MRRRLEGLARAVKALGLVGLAGGVIVVVDEVVKNLVRVEVAVVPMGWPR